MEQQFIEPSVACCPQSTATEKHQSSLTLPAVQLTTPASPEPCSSSSCTKQHGPLLPENALSVQSTGKSLRGESDVGRIREPRDDAILLSKTVRPMGTKTKRGPEVYQASNKRIRLPSKAIKSDDGQEGFQATDGSQEFIVWYKNEDVLSIGPPKPPASEIEKDLYLSEESGDEEFEDSSSDSCSESGSSDGSECSSELHKGGGSGLPSEEREGGDSNQRPGSEH